MGERALGTLVVDGIKYFAHDRILMNKVDEYFGVSGQTFVYGDLDNSGTIDTGDLAYMIDFLYLSFQHIHKCKIT